MKLLRYIAREVWTYCLLVLCALMSMQFFISLLNELGDVGKGQYTMMLAALYCLLELPARTYEFMPIILFMGGLLAFGELANHNELIVMRVSGLNNRRLLMYIVTIAIALGSLMTVCFEAVVPSAQHYANFSKEYAVSNGRSLKKGESLWLRDGDFFIHAKNFLDKTHFRNVYIYQMAEVGKLKSMAYMKRLEQVQASWIAYDYQKTTFKSNRTKSLRLAQLKLPMQLSNLWLMHSSSKQLAEEISLPKLWHRIKSLRRGQIDASEWIYNMFHRLVRPLIIMIMLIMALPFTLGSTRHQSIGLRLTVGLVIGLLYHFVNKFLYVFAMVYHINPIVANGVPLVLFFILAMTIWRRVAD